MATAKKAAAQHPAVHGDSAAEVDKRSADGADGSRHTKEFVVLGPQFGEADGPEHQANKVGVFQEAIQYGLHPRGDVRLDGVETLQDGVSRSFRYSVEVVPASVDVRPQDTATPRSEGQG